LQLICWSGKWHCVSVLFRPDTWGMCWLFAAILTNTTCRICGRML
jgi:hypothetical protein